MAQAELIQPNNTPAQVQSPQPDVAARAEIERITGDTPLFITERDKVFHQWLGDQRDAQVCGTVLSAHRSGVSESCRNYFQQHTKYRGRVLALPAPVIYLRVPSACTPTALFSGFHDALCRQPVGNFGDRRKRIHKTLKSFGVKLIVVGDAHYLKLKAVRELVQIHELLKIPVILVGTEHLYETLESTWQQVHNSFLSVHHFPAMSLNQTGAVVDKWLNAFLKWPEESDLLYENVLKKLHHQTGGLTGPLYDTLQRMAVLAVKRGKRQIDEAIINEVLGSQFQAVSRGGVGDKG